MAKKVLVILAEGFEETEALVPVDLLRRSGAVVTVAGLGSKTIKGSHSITVECDITLDSASLDAYDAIVLPGGMPGSSNLAASDAVTSRVLNVFSKGGLIAAICAAPAVVLGPIGVLEGRKAVCYPGCESYSPDTKFYDQQVLRDGNLITARGAGCAVEFGLEIVSYLSSRDEADKLALKIMY